MIDKLSIMQNVYTDGKEMLKPEEAQERKNNKHEKSMKELLEEKKMKGRVNKEWVWRFKDLAKEIKGEKVDESKDKDFYEEKDEDIKEEKLT